MKTPSIAVLGPVDGAGAIGVRRGDLFCRIVVPETEPRAFLALLVPEIATLVNTVSQVGYGADSLVVRFHK